MDVSAEVDKLTCETAALRNEIWELKELVNRQNERIIYMLQRQNDMLVSMVGEKTKTPLVEMDVSDEATTSNAIVMQRKTPTLRSSKEIKKETPKSKKETTESSKETPQTNMPVTKVEPEYIDMGAAEEESTYAASDAESEESQDLGLDSCFPIASQCDLDNVERKINDRNKEQLIGMLKEQLGPNDLIKNFTFILATDMVLEYNLDGSHSKKRLLNYPKILDVIYKANKRSNYTRSMFMDDIRKALQVAKKKHFQKKSVQNKRKREMEEIDEIFY